MSPFPGKDEKNQMELIFRHCGTPNEQNWPGVSKLDVWRQTVRHFPPARNRLREQFTDKVDRTAVDLIEKMLTLDPEKRITASEALDHDFFWTGEKPCEPSQYVDLNPSAPFCQLTPFV